MHIPILSREDFIALNKQALANNWEEWVDPDFLEETLEEGNNHPIIEALHSTSQLVTCKIMVGPEQAVMLTMPIDKFDQLEVFEIPNTLH